MGYDTRRAEGPREFSEKDLTEKHTWGNVYAYFGGLVVLGFGLSYVVSNNTIEKAVTAVRSVLHSIGMSF